MTDDPRKPTSTKYPQPHHTPAPAPYIPGTYPRPEPDPRLRSQAPQADDGPDTWLIVLVIGMSALAALAVILGVMAADDPGKPLDPCHDTGGQLDR